MGKELECGHIYKITNIINGKIYVGKSKIEYIISRWNGTLKGTNVYNVGFSGDVRKYGVDNFKEEIIEDNIPLEELNKKERYWINFYDSINPDKGYNKNCGSPYSLINYDYKNLKIDIDTHNRLKIESIKKRTTIKAMNEYILQSYFKQLDTPTLNKTIDKKLVNRLIKK